MFFVMLCDTGSYRLQERIIEVFISSFSCVAFVCLLVVKNFLVLKYWLKRKNAERIVLLSDDSEVLLLYS